MNFSTIYHEKQRSQLCAVHAINNLFQDGLLCSKNKMDKLCLRLDPSSWMNQHRSIFGTGNYDINVIMIFLNEQGYDVIWFDKRKYEFFKIFVESKFKKFHLNFLVKKKNQQNVLSFCSNSNIL